MDPLKPFANLIRSAWDRARRVDGTTQATEVSALTDRLKANQATRSDPVPSLQGRLRSRLTTLNKWEPAAARQIFVECVLASELGMELEADPQFKGVARRVGEQLGTDAALSARLDSLLKTMAADRSER